MSAYFVQFKMGFEGLNCVI